MRTRETASSAAEAISFFWPAEYELLVARPARGRDATFVEYQGNQALTQSRLLLICLARQQLVTCQRP